MKSNRGGRSISFSELQLRLLAAVTRRIHNGEITERGLAKVLGISQPQVHHVLKGKRRLRPEMADLLLIRFQIDLRDLLFDEAEPIWFRSPVCGFVIDTEPAGSAKRLGKGPTLTLPRRSLQPSA